MPKCGGVLGGNGQNGAEKQNVVLTWFRPVTWSSGHLGRRPKDPVILKFVTVILIHYGGGKKNTTVVKHYCGVSETSCFRGEN